VRLSTSFAVWSGARCGFEARQRCSHVFFYFPAARLPRRLAAAPFDARIRPLGQLFASIFSSSFIDASTPPLPTLTQVPSPKPPSQVPGRFLATCHLRTLSLARWEIEAVNRRSYAEIRSFFFYNCDKLIRRVVAHLLKRRMSPYATLSHYLERTTSIY
jgi:hypothetical protein